MQVLEVLAETPNQVVSREQLVARVWPGVFVTDDVLHRAIRELRRVFGDETANPTYIEDHPQAGYRLIAPVARPDTAAVTPITLSMQGPPTRTARSWMMIVAASLALAAALGAVVYALALRPSPNDPAPESVRFVAMTSGPLNETDPALSPDGNRLAFAMRPAERQRASRYLHHRWSRQYAAARRRQCRRRSLSGVVSRCGDARVRTHQRPHLRCDGDDARGSPGTSSARAETSKNPVSVGRATANGSSNHSRLVPIPSAGGASRASRRGMACAKS